MKEATWFNDRELGLLTTGLANLHADDCACHVCHEKWQERIEAAKARKKTKGKK